MATALCAAVAPLALSACAPAPTKTISGTVKGVDGHYVDAMLGFDVVDANGAKLNMGLLPQTGYSTIQRLNHCLPASGSSAPTVCSQSGAATFNWSLNVPSNAVAVYVEVYPKNPTYTAWLDNYRGYTGPAAGDTNLSTYSMAFRRAVPVPASRSGVSIVLPKTCGAPGGNTGSLAGRVYGLPWGATGQVNAWSMSPDGQGIMGMGLGHIYSNGTYRIDNLASGQRYGLVADAAGHHLQLTGARQATSNDTLVGACAVKTLNFGM